MICYENMPQINSKLTESLASEEKKTTKTQRAQRLESVIYLCVLCVFVVFFSSDAKDSTYWLLFFHTKFCHSAIEGSSADSQNASR
jgi:hypothetical protein